MNRTFAGIGSRDCPPEVYHWCVHYGKELARIGFTLRSGGAPGCDLGFEIGCDLMQGEKEIFLPWKEFNHNKSTRIGVCKKALEIGEKYHPVWNQLTPSTQKLIARNSYQVLGEDLNNPVDFILCWTPNAKVQGGTAQALRIAEDLKIKVINFADPKQKNAIDSYILNHTLWDSLGYF